MSHLQIVEGGLPAFQVEDFIGQRVAVLGISGSGKSNTAAVLVEELLPHTPLTLVDVEGEMWGLKEQFDILVAGRGIHADLEIDSEQAGALAAFSWTNGVSVILDVSDYDPDEQADLLHQYLSSLWTAARETRRPYTVLVEEAHEFVPEAGRSPVKTLLTRLALRGRKLGIGMIFVSQRSAKVSKDVLTQANVLFLHRVMHPADMAVYKDLIPLPSKQVEEQVRSLRPGQAVVLAQHEACVTQIRRRSTFHAGATPGLEDAKPTLRAVDGKLLADLRRQLSTDAKPKTDDPATQKEPEDLDNHLQAKEAEIKRWRWIATLLALKQRPQAVAGQIVTIEKAVQPPGAPERIDLTGSLDFQADEQVIRRKKTVTVEQETFISSRGLKLRISRQQDAFGRLLNQVRDLRPMARKLLALALDEGNLTVRGAAVGLDYSESRVRTHANELVVLGLLARTETGYENSAESFFAAQYPNLTRVNLVEALWKVVEE